MFLNGSEGGNPFLFRQILENFKLKVIIILAIVSDTIHGYSRRDLLGCHLGTNLIHCHVGTNSSGYNMHPIGHGLGLHL